MATATDMATGWTTIGIWNGVVTAMGTTTAMATVIASTATLMAMAMAIATARGKVMALVRVIAMAMATGTATAMAKLKAIYIVGWAVPNWCPWLPHLAVVGCCILFLAEAAAPPKAANPWQHNLENDYMSRQLGLISTYLQYC
jgi:hypothetical protein